MATRTARIHSRDLVEMARHSLDERYGLSTRSLGFEVLGVLIEGLKRDEAERAVATAYEQGDDYRLGIEAIAVLRHVKQTRRHCVWTARLECSHDID